nr:MAG TPA: Chromatin remodeling complex ATPase [Caudoviricetes sp.]
MIKLHPHQERAIKQANNRERVAYYLDMGLGKTFVASEQAKLYENDVILVICQNSKVSDWSEHFEKFYSNKVFSITSTKVLKSYVDYQGKKVGVINYEKTYRDNYKRLLELTEFTLIIDESSVLGNSKTNISKFVQKLKFKNLVLLSGTPTSGKYEKLWTQLNLLGWDIKETKFYNQFLNRKLLKRFGRTFYQMDKKEPYKNVNRLKRKMREYGCVFMKTEEVFDLPEQNFIELKIENDENYKEFEEHCIVKFKNVKIIGDTVLNYRLGLRQLACIYNENKKTRLKDLINSTEGRLIIFYNFNDELRAIKDCIPKDRPVSYVNGSCVDKNNYNTYDNSITLMQYQAGAKGHNMQKANHLIFYSPTEKCEDYMQSIKRIHRIGQERPCFYYKFIVKDSIEEQIYYALEKGEDYTNELFNTGIREKTLTTISTVKSD